ncbi:MAG: chorismate-binding protein [Bdellovibrionota bacterium]
MPILEGDFPEKGAFLKNPEGDTLIFGTGGQFDVVKNFSPENHEVFFLKDFYSDSYLRYAPEKIHHLSPLDVTKLIQELETVRPAFQSLGTEDRIYEDDFQDLLKSFSGILRKVVMISRENFMAENPEGTIPHLIRKALTFGTGSPYGLWGINFGIIGSTPEELFTLKKGILTTHALAGTSKKGQEAELMNSQKDLLEHNLVVQDISEKLNAFSDKIHVTETYTTEFKDIIHLKTDITAAVSEDTDIVSLVTALSPTAALGGYPKKESMKFLRSTRYTKKYPERSFGSAMGLVTRQESRFVVMIRNVQWKNDTFFIESGGGVVQGSELKKEMNEISWKRNVVKDHYL